MFRSPIVKRPADSLERIIPEQVEPGSVTGSEALRISIERYVFAVKFLKPGRLLDMACGVGYGTRLLADRAPQVHSLLGVDISSEAIEYADGHYRTDRVSFLAADAMQLRDREGFDTIVSIETIEHLEEPEGFVERLVELLKPNSILVASVPVTPSVDANPHHLHDFTPSSFRALFRRHGLIELESLLQDQPFTLGTVVGRSEARLSGLRRNLPLWYMRHPGSLLRRIGTTLRYGFKNRYLTIAWQRPHDSMELR